ncbi:MAG: hypothetical protein B193_2544 [Solidesulfovibrio magneticus str. Maddingley MBC34]|uniref:Uncharacterized protein n=1 Tax=Solidesulfovibrio magneticus str. Maddingley MBC34 TaxID=1206767 RepID=K6FJI3_9BACT|nr:MAG: hypothetical protein B193_2544 [Solidesulfovibrio magneticus str. Maddingley MBC34]
MFHRRLLAAALIAALTCLTVPAAKAAKPAPAEATETPPTFSAAALLPDPVLVGPNHSVDDKVVNDGYINTYIIHTPKSGDLRVESTAKLYATIQELNAAAAMDQVNAGAEIGKSVAKSAAGAVTGAFNLIVHPADSLSNVGKSFSRATASAKSDRPTGDDGTMGELLGYNRAKREYAKAFSVNPYSDDPVLQKSLKRLAGAGFFGSFAASAAIPGGAALTFINNANLTPQSAVDVSIPPEDLFASNRERLKAMGVSQEQADLFVDNPNFDPIMQTRFTLALDRMTNVAGRPAFVKFALFTNNADLAFFRTRMAELYANLNATTDPIKSFITAGKFVLAETQNGGILAAFPLDYLAWTPQVADIAAILGDAATAKGAKTKKIVVAGEISPLAAKALKKGGWTVVQLREGLRASR